MKSRILGNSGIKVSPLGSGECMCENLSAAEVASIDDALATIPMSDYFGGTGRK